VGVRRNRQDARRTPGPPSFFSRRLTPEERHWFPGLA
jgi:hypothetical protein